MTLADMTLHVPFSIPAALGWIVIFGVGIVALLVLFELVVSILFFFWG